MPRKRKPARNGLDPFFEIAQGLTEANTTDVWQETPVTIQQFIEDKEFLGQKWDEKNKRGCRPYIMEVAKNVVAPNVREAVLLLGKGCLSGNTIIWTDVGARKMRDIVGKIVNVQSHDDDGNGLWNQAICVFRGIKPIYRYIFDNGTVLKSTTNHIVKSNGICVKISKLRIGDTIPAPSRLLNCEKIKDNNNLEYTDAWIGQSKRTKTYSTYFPRLIAINKCGVEDVYDLICQHPCHNYCADGVYVCNSGKDYVSSIIHLYGIYRCLCMYNPQLYYGLAPGSPIYFVNTARNDEQAKRVFFTEFKGMLENCPWFRGKHGEPSTSGVFFDNNLIAISANSQAYSWLGYNTLQWVGDELAFFLTKDSDEESESLAEKCWEAAYGSCQTRFPEHYKMIGITTPRYDDDFVMRKFHELQSRTKDAYVAQAATWEANPKLTKEDFAHAFQRDFRRAMRDFGAQPSGVIESFWADPDFVDNNPCSECRSCPVWQNRAVANTDYCCRDYDKCMANPYRGNGEWNTDLLVADPSAEYFMHFDLSKNKDALGFALVHVVDWVTVELDGFQLLEIAKERRIELDALDREDMIEEKPLLKVDAMGWIEPQNHQDPNMMKNNEIYYTALENRIMRFLLDKGFNIVKITFDSYQSLHLKQRIQDWDIESDILSLDRDDTVPSASKTAFVENRVEYPWDRKFAREARHLKFIKGKKVDHARGFDKATCDAIFGAVYNAETHTGNAAWEALDE